VRTVTERSSLAGRDYIETLDWTVEEIDEALALAGELKAKPRRESYRLLPDETFMLFSTSPRGRGTRSRPG
jgi:ornithine carbamoyltransferase